MKNRNWVALFLIVALVSCERSRNFDIASASFFNANASAILRANIDTTFLVAASKNLSFDNNDTLGYMVYDSLGRLLKDGQMFDSFEYTYDSAGMLSQIRHRDWDVHIDYSVSYQFHQDTVYQKFQAERWEYTNVLHFDDNGLLVEKISNRLDQEPRNLMIHHSVDSIRERFARNNFRLSTKIHYNVDGLKSKEVVSIIRDNATSEVFSTSDFHYSQVRLDSIVTDFATLCHINVIMFDENGLMRATRYGNIIIGYGHSYRNN